MREHPYGSRGRYWVSGGEIEKASQSRSTSGWLQEQGPVYGRCGGHQSPSRLPSLKRVRMGRKRPLKKDATSRGIFLEMFFLDGKFAS